MAVVQIQGVESAVVQLPGANDPIEKVILQEQMLMKLAQYFFGLHIRKGLVG
jgi:hypothetical protein